MLGPPPEWRVRGIIGADVIAVSAGNGAVACVEVRSHLVSGGDPNVLRQHRVQRSPEHVGGPLRWNANPHGLSTRVHACIRASRAKRSGRLTVQPLEGLLE